MKPILCWQDLTEAQNWMKVVDTMLAHRPDLTLTQIYESADDFTKATRDRRTALLIPPGRS